MRQGAKRQAAGGLWLALLAAVIGLIGWTPQPVGAVGNEIDVIGGITYGSVDQGESAPLTLQLAATSAVSAAKLRIGLPDGAVKLSSSGSCAALSVSGTEGTLTLTANIPAVPDFCTVTIPLRFDTCAITVTASDFTFTAQNPSDATLDDSEFFANMEVGCVEGYDAGGDEESEVGSAPTVCRTTPDMAVSPQFIELAPGGQATVEVALRNLCDDAPTAIGDLLVSFSDGLSVVTVDEKMINLGQRAAVQRLSLSAGETRRWQVTVAASSVLPVAPQHVTELYVGGRVAQRIDGVFIETAAVEAPAAAAVEPVVPAPAVPIPAALPNTAGGEGGSAAILVSLVLLLAGSLLQLRRR
jgi:hypothetical protein